MIAPRKLTAADLFCGAGGTSTGLVEAARECGYEVELTAVNHWEVAIATHSENHPGARHVCASLDSINPRELFREGELDLLWASPECTHHSVARGGRPINEQSRATAWCVLRWADALRPPTILIENVPEFVTWGGLGVDGRPLKAQKGRTFMAFVAALESLGYRVDWRVLCAADYGDPTTRRRLFVQAVRGRRRIVWPEPTHAPAEDLDLLGERKRWVAAREVIDWDLPSQSIFERKRPLKAKTMQRIWAGLRKFGLNPMMVQMQGTNLQQVAESARSVEEPVPTVTATGLHTGLAQPYLVCMEHKGKVRSSSLPFPTITTARAGAIGVAQPFLVNVAHKGGDRVQDVETPMPTITGNRGELALCDAQACLLPQQQGGALRPVSQPAPTVATDGAIALVEPFLMSYYGTSVAQSVAEPLDTVTTKDRHALVRPKVVVDGKRYLLDIRFRMLQPHELAGAQGFPRSYRFSGTKTEQVKQIGNAVPKNLAKALVRAVIREQCAR